MSTKTEGQILAEAMDSVRNLTNFYFSQLDDKHLHTRFEINGVKFNSPYWITAHLVWSEHFLIVRGVGNKDMNIPWLDEFGFGSNPDEVNMDHDLDIILDKMDEVHTEAMKILKELPDEEIDKPNHINAVFGQKNTKAAVIRHCIRHEPMHVGQISWIIKMCGGKTGSSRG
jgi:DinB superfamily